MPTIQKSAKGESGCELKRRQTVMWIGDDQRHFSQLDKILFNTCSRYIGRWIPMKYHVQSKTGVLRIFLIFCPGPQKTYVPGVLQSGANNLL